MHVCLSNCNTDGYVVPKENAKEAETHVQLHSHIKIKKQLSFHLFDFFREDLSFIL